MWIVHYEIAATIDILADMPSLERTVREYAPMLERIEIRTDFAVFTVCELTIRGRGTIRSVKQLVDVLSRRSDVLECGLKFMDDVGYVDESLVRGVVVKEERLEKFAFRKGVWLRKFSAVR